MGSKFDNARYVTVNDLIVENIQDLYDCKLDLTIEGLYKCNECGSLFTEPDKGVRTEINYEDYWDYMKDSPRQRERELEVDYEACPVCGYGSNEDEELDVDYLFISDLFESDLKDLDEFTGNDFVNELNKFKENLKRGESKMTENKKQNLQEATIKALYDGLEDTKEVKDVEGLISDVLVVTDPEITTDEYNEVIERAQEIVENTPEGDIPLDPTYLGEYLQICPICGGSFVEDHILEPGTACPICFEQPESFVLVGKLQSEDTVAEDNGIEPKEDENNEMELNDELDMEDISQNDNLDVEPEIEDDTELDIENDLGSEERINTQRPVRGARTRRDRDLASRQYNRLGNVLNERKLQESKDDSEYVVENIDFNEEKFFELVKESAFTWEGMNASEESLKEITKFLKENTTIKTPITYYIYSGKSMNEICGLTENNAYPDDLTFISIDLDNFDGMGNLPIIKMQVGARWLDDIYDNNKARQDMINGTSSDEE